AALYGDLSALDAADQQRALRAQALLAQLTPLVDRLPVAELLQRVIDATDYRAVLASAQPRLWRNIDKLLLDAQRSPLVQARAFLPSLDALRESDVRSPEAPADVAGAVQLMTIHAAKGLEFATVVIADAARQRTGNASSVILLPDTGLTFGRGAGAYTPLTARVARWLDKEQDAEEEKRLLYVAATRARERLLFSAHITSSTKGWKTSGWASQLVELVGIDLATVAAATGACPPATLPCAEHVGVWGAQLADLEPANTLGAPSIPWQPSTAAPLHHPLRTQPGQQRESAKGVVPAGTLTGTMVHAALRRWLFPGDPQLIPLLAAVALENGLITAEQRADAVARAQQLLVRLREHPLWATIAGAHTRHHELAYILPLADGRVEEGCIDLLYRAVGGWHLLDFKVDWLADEAALEAAFAQHRPQIERYVEAVEHLLGTRPTAQICFLNTANAITVVSL
ncbi:MAG: hypothetical protein H7Y32_06495, partial [Chloroflexales bacterium]|nr:hypothetical protein [Chloroflexales bacterium]